VGDAWDGYEEYEDECTDVLYTICTMLFAVQMRLPLHHGASIYIDHTLVWTQPLLCTLT
jgi:hypothetical protein